MKCEYSRGASLVSEKAVSCIIEKKQKYSEIIKKGRKKPLALSHIWNTALLYLNAMINSSLFHIKPLKSGL